MADLVTSQTVFNGSKRTIRAFTSVSDGTGESAVTKVDISTLTGAPTAVRIMKVWYDIVGMSVKVIFDHTTDDTALVLAGQGFLDFSSFGGVPDPASAGATGDVLFTTVNHGVSDTYTIVLELEF